MLGKEYNITFDSNGGSVIDSSVIVSYYEKYGELPIPTKPNNEFLGWYTESGEKIDSSSLVKIKDNHTLIAKWKEICSVGDTWDFDYTGSEQNFTVPCSGTYKIQLWGAKGGDGSSVYIGGKGAYVSGQLVLSKMKNLYIYIGEQGENKSTTKAYGTKNFNGGGGGNYTCYDYHKIYNGISSAYNIYGGGATDLRLVDGKWDDLNGLRSRIIVAAGGGSANDSNFGAAGGGLEGFNAGGTKGTQVSAGSINGGFGFGGHPAYGGAYCNSSIQVGAGSGYYGGGGSSIVGNNTGGDGGASGSSFISGHTGCVAITSSTDQSPKSGCTTGTTDNNCSIHYSGYVFTNTKMIDGAGYTWTNVKGMQEQMPNPTGGYYDLGVGHSGNGYARITLVSY